jgi:hypothetical protein
MAVSSLTKFTVPLGGNQSASAQGLLMPKLKFRFRVSFENFGITQPTTELTKQVIDFTRPTVNFDPIEIPVYNSRVYLAGKPNWEMVTVNFRDDATGSVARLIGEQIQKQFDFMEQSSASSGIDYKFVTRLEMLDGANGANEPVILETWEMYGCFVTNVNYNDVNYGSNEAATITMQMRFDNALQVPQGSGIGAAIDRTNGSTATG